MAQNAPAKPIPDNIIMSQSMRERYGDVMGLLGPDLGKYDIVMMFTEKEINDIHNIFMDNKVSMLDKEKVIYEYLKKAHPGVDLDGRLGHYAREFCDNMYEVSRNQGPGQVGAEARSMLVGTKQRPFLMGYIVLPDKLDFGPEYLSFMPESDHRYKPQNPGDLERRQHDNGILTVAHEVGHLAEAARRRRYGGTNDALEEFRDEDTVAAGIFRESEAERYSFDKIPALMAAGIIRSDYSSERLDNRNVMSFNYMMQNAFKVGTYGGIGIEPHSIGFDLHNRTMSGDDVYNRLDKAFTTLRELRNQEYRAAFEDAAQGKGSPAALAAYADMQKRMNNPEDWLVSVMRKDKFPDADIAFMLFGNTLGTDRAGNYAFAQKIKDSPQLDSAGREFLRRYIESADRVSNYRERLPAAAPKSAFLEGGDFDRFMARTLQPVAQPAETTQTAAAKPVQPVAAPAPVV